MAEGTKYDAIIKTEGREHNGKEKEEIQANSELKEGLVEIKEHIWNLLKSKADNSNIQELKYDSEKQSLEFKSSDVYGFKILLDKVQADIIEDHLEMHDNMQIILNKLIDDKHFLKMCFDEYMQKNNVQCIIGDASTAILFYGWVAEDIQKTKQEVKNRFFHSVKIQNENCDNVEEIMREEKEEQELDYMVIISWTDCWASNIQIDGVFDDVSLVKQHFENLLSRYKIIESHFEFSQEHTSFIEQYCKQHLDSILCEVNVSFRGKIDQTYCIEYSTIFDKSRKTEKALKDFKLSITFEEINVGKDFDPDTSELVTKMLNQAKSKSSFSYLQQNSFQIKNQCCIVNDLKFEKTPHQIKKKTKAQTSASHFHPSIAEIQVKIKNRGNLVKEVADVLVCPIHESKQMKTLTISKSFLEQLPHLQTIVDGINFSSGDVQLYNISSSVVKCKAIAFVLLSSWSLRTPKDYLQKLILDILTKAAEMNAESVTFPPFGLGRVLQYSCDNIAKQFFSAAKDFKGDISDTNTLTMITILAGDLKFYHSLLTEYTQFKLYCRDVQNTSEECVDSEDENILRQPLACKANIKIIHCQNDTLAPLWKETLKSCIHKDEYCLNVLKLPSSLKSQLEKRLKDMMLIIQISKNYRGVLVLKFKGLQSHIQEIKSLISREFKFNRAYIISEYAPPRNTLEFINYAASIEECAPAFWTYRKQSDYKVQKVREVEVDDKTRDAIKSIFLNTWDSSLTGVGNDAKKIPKNSTVEIVGIRRLENLSRFKLYSQARKSVFEKKAREKEICESISKVSARKQDCLLLSFMSDYMKEQLCHEINESYLFHGTKPEFVDLIKINGLDPTKTDPGAMFGQGVYASESSIKCDQYTDSPKHRLPPGSVHYIFLSRMLLGDIFLCDQNHPTVQDNQKLRGVVCKKCEEDECSCDSESYDSVLGEGKWIFREFVVYKGCHCYPEYLIEYKRN